MTMTVLGSGSSGNCYILDDGEDALVLEAGVPFPAVRKALGGVLSRVSAVLVTHEHRDHAGYLRRYLTEGRMPARMSAGTLAALGLSEADGAKAAPMMTWSRSGAYSFMPFPVDHDATAPCGYIVHHPSCGSILFVTDTCGLPRRFRGLSHIMIECNYAWDILATNLAEGLVTAKQAERVVRMHMSLSSCLTALAATDLGNVMDITLLHMSNRNSDEVRFVHEVEAATGKAVVAAKTGTVIDFTL